MHGTERKKAIVRAFWGIRKSDLRFYAPNESYNCSLLQAGFFPSSVSYARPLMRRRRFLFFRFIIIIHVFICELRNAQSHTHTRAHARIDAHKDRISTRRRFGNHQNAHITGQHCLVAVVIVVDVDWHQNEASITSVSLPCDAWK